MTFLVSWKLACDELVSKERRESTPDDFWSVAIESLPYSIVALGFEQCKQLEDENAREVQLSEISLDCKRCMCHKQLCFMSTRCSPKFAVNKCVVAIVTLVPMGVECCLPTHLFPYITTIDPIFGRSQMDSLAHLAFVRFGTKLYSAWGVKPLQAKMLF